MIGSIKFLMQILKFRERSQWKVSFKFETADGKEYLITKQSRRPLVNSGFAKPTRSRFGLDLLEQNHLFTTHKVACGDHVDVNTTGKITCIESNSMLPCS